MPGIVGIIGSGSVKEHATVLQGMVKSMMHERFYTSGIYSNEQLGLCAGWICHRGSFADCMPVWNETNDICMIFSGEIFADEGIINKLRFQGHEFDPLKANYLLHLFEEYDEEFLRHLNGWFSGILINLRQGEVILFNDRYGMQRIYYHESKDAFYFSSESKSLLRGCPGLRALDMKSLGEVMSFGCVLENRTLFSNISLLPTSSVWTFRNGKAVRKNNYFKQAIWENQQSLGKEAFYNQFRETFVNILPRYFHTKNKIALSLTGGLDTRMILSCMNVPSGGLPCYTFGGMYRDCFDVKVARKVAAACHQTHKVLEVGKKFFSEFPSLAEKTIYITDGNLDVSGSADLYVNRLAREIAPVRITGNYGSEILRGARHLKALPVCTGLFDGDFEKHISAAADTLSENSQGHKISFAAFKQAPWYHYNRLALEQSQLTLRSPYLDNDLVALMFQAPAEVINSSELSFRLINDGSLELGNIMTDRGLGGNNGYLSSKFAHFYHEFLFKAEYAFNYGMPQWLARLDHHLLAPTHIDRMFIGRHKFYHFRVWFRDELSGYVKEILLDQRSLQRPYLGGNFVQKMVLDHTSGRLNYTIEITKLLTIELLQRLLIDHS
jgi:asparagine synthase (glutamine-hydrolysing)